MTRLRHRFHWLVYGVPLFCLLVLAAASRIRRGTRESADAPQPPVLQLLCGAALRPPVSEIAEAFQRRFGVKVEVLYGASNLLLGQLELTRQGDVFLPGDAFYTDEAARRGLATHSQTVAWFVPVIQVARGNPGNIQTVAALADPGVRLAVADERAAAIGRIAPDLFRLHGVSMEDVRRNTVFTAITAPEAAQAVALGHADAAVVWKPVALQYPLTEIVPIPADQNVRSPIDAAVLASAARTAAAHDFVRFLTGPAGREAFRRYHYELDAHDR